MRTIRREDYENGKAVKAQSNLKDYTALSTIKKIVSAKESPMSSSFILL